MILYTLIPAYKWNKEESDGQRAGTKDFNQSDSLAFVIFKMRDLQFSLNFNFSRQNSNGWQNFSFDDNSQGISLPKNHSVNDQSLAHFQALLNQPPRPPASIYNCIESDQEEQGQIREVEYVQNQAEAKHVNSKQYFRMMKRRIKKVISQYSQHKEKGTQPAQVPLTPEEMLKRPKYLYESRHKHAARRPRGKDGKFLASKSLSIQHALQMNDLERRRNVDASLRSLSHKQIQHCSD